LNPDVTVRSRGVMEKCSLCVQRIQEVKAEAKRRGRPVRDGEIQTACQQSCPSQAIVFGDLNDPESRISRLARDPRAYKVLEELNVKPSVSYLRVVRNREDAPAQALTTPAPPLPASPPSAGRGGDSEGDLDA
jgi:molybdopterin-containing oxidoreductase family iron-sulfur binding subunit